MSTSVLWALIIVIAMPLAITLSEASRVPVTRDLWAMELIAQVSFELLETQEWLLKPW